MVILPQKGAPLADVQRRLSRFRRGGKFVVQADGARHGEQKRLSARERRDRLLRRRVRQKRAVLQNEQSVAKGQNLLQTVLDQNDRQRQLPTELVQRGDKVCGGDRIQLRRRLVQQKHGGTRHHHGSEIQKLLLTARKRARIPQKKLLHAEIARHLRHTTANLSRGHAHIFGTESQLVPDLIGHDLLLGLLHHVSDLLCRSARGQGFQRSALEKDLALHLPHGREFPLQKAEKRGFSASRRAADHDPFALGNGKGKVLQRGRFIHGVTKA